MAITASSMIRVLLIEDNPGDSRLMELLLSEVGGFDMTFADCLASGLARLAANGPDAVLLDLSLPDAHGTEGIDAIRKAAPDVPLIVVTGLQDEDMALKAVQHGCQDYLIKGQGDGHSIRRTILYGIERMAMDQERRASAERLKQVLRQTVRTVSLALEMRDPYTTGHQRRVSQLAGSIGRRLGLADDMVEGLETGGLIHDIGKIHIPAEFLSRPGKLSAEAFQVIKTHPRMGWEIIRNIDFPWPVAQMVRQHHECMDGSGYPDGLKGDQIILEARIIAVADVFEAIVSHRPYRPALGLAAAMEEIERHSGTRYDPKVVAACLDLVREKDGAMPFDEDPTDIMRLSS
ncbi:response regulator [Paramagnetospirillum marisnigri]|uniref:Response regulator n=1 Tax=Paramagnetospirillum marisnigri TaxID=1285242 RepID=A0A178MS12_9PROT|nr:HD-GYP domain-containing protein [Paramagnetospirillum marisnigri]OAN52178.1 response regulator [Paramagnetospirillum marisnigri]